MTQAAPKNPAKRVLLVDDDEVLRAAIKGCLEQSGYEVVTAPNGKVAQHLVGVERLDMVISDIRMPEMGGIELLHFVKRTKPMPVILMTGFAELSETQEAFSLGADEFVAKPFKREELLEAVNICCDVSDQGDVAQDLSDEDYCKIGIDDFISGREIQSDIFIRLSDRKYVKIAHQGEDIPIDRIKAYKSKNIRHLYMKKADFRKYVGFNLALAGVVKASGKVTKIKKLNFLKHTGEIILEHLYNNDIDKEGFDDAKTMVETTTGIISDDKDLFDLLSVLNTHADHLYAHSLGVSLYSVMIARKMGWNSPQNTFKIATGGLLHDIGKKEIDRAVLLKARKDLTPEEVKMIESHASRGLEILGSVRAIPSDVLQIVSQHHENCMGTGYPAGLKKKAIHPMARLVSVANEFCNLAIQGPQGAGSPPREAIERMLTLYVDILDHKPMAALMRIFKMQVPDGFEDQIRKSEAA